MSLLYLKGLAAITSVFALGMGLAQVNFTTEQAN